MQSTKLQLASYILLALLSYACKNKSQLTARQTLDRIDVSQIQAYKQLYNIDLLIIDSTIEYLPTDTIKRVRHLHAKQYTHTSDTTVTTFTEIDTTAAVEATIPITPIAVEEKKNGVAWLRPQFKIAFVIIFLIISPILLQIEKKLYFCSSNSL